MRQLAVCIVTLLLAASLQATEQFVFFENQNNCVNLSNLHGQIQTDPKEYKGVLIAADNLKKDLFKVMGRSDLPVLAGTVGKSKAIDRLLKKKKIDGSLLKDKREMFVISFIDGNIVIAGSDKRGTIYGIYELSEQLGVSPWYDWADVPVVPRSQVYIKHGTFTDGEPAVRYRGIFLNDEAPALSGWVGENYRGVYNHEFYARVFELVLRLKGNFMWPAMWNSSFYADDPLNMQTADEMGVIMGTSHHEPMGRAHKEWTRGKNRGPWNYDANQAELDEFWRTGVERLRNTEDVVTVGMRGNGDEPMGDNVDVALLERIVGSQRKLIEQATGRPAEETPQVWALYKEVQEYYERGMKVPDDVILLLCDDNWGNVRVLPELDDNGSTGVFSKRHPGGYGMYYHVDYVGGPRNSKWINVSQVQRMWEQLQLTYDYGVDQLWILNVGDLKPMEFPIDFWFRMAWNPSRFNASNLQAYTESFCRQQFGDTFAVEAARILNLQCKYVHRRTAEQLEARTYDLLSGEWQQRLDEYEQLDKESQLLRSKLPSQYLDAYDELIGFPVSAMANLYRMYFAHAMNRYLADKNDSDANRWADEVERCFHRDAELCHDYNHRVAGGKWNHMMDEIHIGYRSWNAPRKNACPEVKRVENGESGAGAFTPQPHKIIAIEAADYKTINDAKDAKWQVIPDFGVYEDAIGLFPYTASTEGASVEYAFSLSESIDKPQLTLVLAPTFPFNSGRGQCLEILVDGKRAGLLNVNEASRYVVNGYHDQNYEWEKTRMNRQRLQLSSLSAGAHTIILRPLDPGIVIERLEIQP